MIPNPVQILQNLAQLVSGTAFLSAGCRRDSISCPLACWQNWVPCGCRADVPVFIWASAESHSQTCRSCYTPWLTTSFLHVQSQKQGVQSFLCHICLTLLCPPLAHWDSVIRWCAHGSSGTSSPHQCAHEEQSQLWGWACGHLSWKHYSVFLPHSDISSNVDISEGSSLITENIVFTVMIITCIYFAYLFLLGVIVNISNQSESSLRGVLFIAIFQATE